HPLEDGDITDLLNRAVADERGLAGKVELTPEALDHLVRMASGDARRALTVLEAAAGSVLSGDFAGAAEADERAAGEGVPDATSEELVEPVAITVEDVERAADVAAVRYDRAGDQHYDLASAL